MATKAKSPKTVAKSVPAEKKPTAAERVAAIQAAAEKELADKAAKAPTPKVTQPQGVKFNTGPGTPDTKIDGKVKVPTVKKAAASKAGEKSAGGNLNPQPILEAKKAALKELGLKLTYAGRQWKAGTRTFTSLELSKYTVESFTKLFAKA
jgi:hypothetical protein